MELNIKTILKKEYGISVLNIEQLNIGFDINTKVFKVYSFDNNTYFLKIRYKVFSELSLLIPFWLSKNTSIEKIIAPIETVNGKICVKQPSFLLCLFPYINGQSGWNIPLTNEQFVELGKFMKDLHTSIIPQKSLKGVPKEIYNQRNIKFVKNCIKNISKQSNKNEMLNALKNELITYKNTLLEMISYLEGTVKEINSKSRGINLCHGDIHAGNIFIDKNRFYVVDWDTIILAPKERDLMFIGGGIGCKWNKKEEVEYFYKGYGRETQIDKTLLKYYRFERIMQDICEFYYEINTKENDREKQIECLELFKSQFEPGNVVEMAFL